MIAVHLAAPDDFDGWRDEARRLVQRGVPPDQVAWAGSGEVGDLFARPVDHAAAPPDAAPVRASKSFLTLAGSALMHRDADRFALAYRLLWRLQSCPTLIEDMADPDVRALHYLAKTVRRDIHKMRAFVRFRLLVEETGFERFVAWFEPDHHIVRANARFFVDRFTNQRWSILTPDVTLHWDGTMLGEGPGAVRADAPAEDATEALWAGYYQSIFNPARLKVGAMLKEMPRRYWKNLPEAQLIPALIAGAQAREAAMIDTGRSVFDGPVPHDLGAVENAIATCRQCPIGCNGTRAVMGEGPSSAPVMIVGEQPGDHEEQQGRPFVGPAGQVLDQHLIASGIDRSRAFVTNAVKHFKFEQRGLRRLHQNPTAGEIDLCRWWLDSERAVVRPNVILTLGASGARGILGRTPALGRERGRPIVQPDGTVVWMTVHPSYLLRLTGEAQARETARFQDDMAGFSALLSTV